jgi:hypothetical protein
VPFFLAEFPAKELREKKATESTSTHNAESFLRIQAKRDAARSKVKGVMNILIAVNKLYILCLLWQVNVDEALQAL